MSSSFHSLKYIFKGHQLAVENFQNIDEEQAKFVLKMRNHPDIKKYMREMDEISLEDHLNYLKSLKKRKDKAYWVVKDLEHNEVLGTIAFSNIKENSGEFGIYKNPFLSAKGIGTFLGQLLLEIGFKEFQFDEIFLEVKTENDAAQALYGKLGFKQQKGTDSSDGFLKMILKKHDWS